jgi:hypothetical protein
MHHRHDRRVELKAASTEEDKKEEGIQASKDAG